jgi:hypothetical protein
MTVMYLHTLTNKSVWLGASVENSGRNVAVQDLFEFEVLKLKYGTAMLMCLYLTYAKYLDLKIFINVWTT